VGGFPAAIVFPILFFGLFFWVFFVASKNAADSGESGILSVLLNMLIVYLVFGGLRLERRRKDDPNWHLEAGRRGK